MILLPVLFPLGIPLPAAIPVMAGDVDMEGAMSSVGGLLLLLGNAATMLEGGERELTAALPLLPLLPLLLGRDMSTSVCSEGMRVGVGDVVVVVVLAVPMLVVAVAVEGVVEGKIKPGAMPLTAPPRVPMLMSDFLCEEEEGGGEGQVLAFVIT